MRWILFALLAGGMAVSPTLAQEKTSPKKAAWKKLLAGTADEKPASVVGVRGLEKSKTVADSSARDYKAVDRLEALTVSPQELTAFIKEGQLR
jgi:hypothetical protein